MSGPAVGSPEWMAQDKGTGILVACWVATSISTIFVVSRVYVTGFMKHKLHSDDWFIITGQLCGYLSVIFATLAVVHGNGRHMAALTQAQQSGAILWTTVGFVPGLLSFGLPKLAVVSLLTRLLNPSRYHRWFLWWLGVWCLASVIVTGILLLARCSPANSLWDFSVKGTCFDVQYLIDFGLYAGSFSAFVDVYLAIYPAVVLFRLQLPLKKKLALSSALGIGTVSGVVAIYKTTRVPSIGSRDFSYDTSDLVVWTVIEGSAIIIAASIPVLQPLLELMLKRNPFASHNRTSKRDKSGSSSGYNNLSDSRGGGYRFEMGDRGGKPSSKKKRGAMDEDVAFSVTTTTMTTTTAVAAGDEATASQEEILKPHGKFDAGYVAEVCPAAPPLIDGLGRGGYGGDGGKGVMLEGGIMRTDVVDISYHVR